LGRTNYILASNNGAQTMEPRQWSPSNGAQAMVSRGENGWSGGARILTTTSRIYSSNNKRQPAMENKLVLKLESTVLFC
jgi:hypothetical protein